MSLDIFYVDMIPCLTSISRKLLFTTARALRSRDNDTVISAIMEVISFYKMHEHEVDFILSDNEFGPLKKRIRKDMGAELNLSSPNEQVPEVERNIRLIKERLRSMLAGMPYSKIPTNFKRELILTCASMLNVIPREASVSNTLSPMELLTGRSLDYKKLCVLAPGTYCLVHEEHLPRNSMRERATGAIAIGPTATLQGAYRFLSLRSGHIITRRNWTVMPVPPEAVDRVEQLAEEEGNREIEFDYRGTTYSTSDLEPTQNNEIDGEEVIIPPQENDDDAPVEQNMNAQVENNDDEDDTATNGDVNEMNGREDEQNNVDPAEDILIQEEVEEYDPPPLEELLRVSSSLSKLLGWYSKLISTSNELESKV